LNYGKDGITKREQYQRTYAALWDEKSSFDATWRELADFVKPKRLRAYTSDRNKGDRRNQKIIDSTATFALRTLQAGMHAGLTSPSRPWFQLSTSDPDLAKFKPVKQWLHDVTQLMLSRLLKSNIYTALPTLYADQGLFATAAMALMEDSRELFRCYPYPIGTYAIGLSRRSTVDTFIREYQMSVRQLADEFGLENLSITAKNLYDRGNYEAQVDVCWIVAPNPEHDPERLAAKYKPWASCHFEKGAASDTFLRESGFDEFPIIAPRWEATPEDVWGTESPGMNAIGDIKGLQTMTKRKAQAVEKMINPPLQAPSHLQNQVISLLPGGVTFADQTQANNGIRPIHDIVMSIEDVRVDINDMRYLIQTAFYQPLFLMMATADATGANPQKTAREIEERHEEKLLALGPVVERNNDELHEPTIDRVYAMMDRAGEIPPAPPDLEGAELKVEYLSIMSQAQKLVGVTGLRNFLRDAAPLVEIFPETRYKIKPFRILDELGDAYGINPEILESDDVAEGQLQQAQQAAAEQRQVEMAAQAAKAGRDLGSTPMNEDTALTRVLQGA